jgi:hypothetical protein
MISNLKNAKNGTMTPVNILNLKDSNLFKYFLNKIV